MFKIQNKALYISRTESGKVIVRRKDNAAITTDIKELRIYNKEALDEAPVYIIEGEYLDTEFNTSISFDLGKFTTLKEDKIEYSNEPVEYWYEIRINDKIILGYDETKAKILYLYPAGKDSTEA